MSALRHRLSHLRRDDGMTIIEVLVVILIIGIIGMVGLDIISSTTNATVRASEQYLKLGSADRAVSFLQARVGGIDDALGSDSGTAVNRLTIARDQIVFVESSTGDDACVRVFYEKAQARLRAKVVVPDGTTVSSPCTDAAIKPVRGPNQPPAGSSTPGEKAASDASDFDPAQDLGPGQQATVAGKTYTGAIELATNLVSQRPSGASADMPDPLSVFTFRDASDQPLPAGGGQGPDEEASSNGSANAWYADKTNRQKITAVDVILYLNAPKAQPMTAPLARKATIYVGGGRSKTNARGASSAPTDRTFAYNSATQYVDSGDNNAGPVNMLHFDSEITDTGNMHDVAANNGRIVVQQDGLYVIDASFRLTAPFNGYAPGNYGTSLPATVYGYLFKNGSVIHQQSFSANQDTYMVSGLMLKLQVGDVLEMGVSSGAYSPYGGLDNHMADRYIMGGTAADPNGCKLTIRPW